MSGWFVNRLSGAAVGPKVFVNLVTFSSILMTVWWVRNMFYEVSHSDFFGSQFFAGDNTLRADCEILVSSLGNEYEWQLL